MAQRRLQITITVDTAKAVQQVTNLNNALAASSQSAAKAAQGQAQATQQAAGANKQATASQTALATQIASTKQQISDLQTAMDANRRSAYAFTIAGFQLAAAGAAMTAALKSSYSVFADYDYSLRRAAGALEIFDANSRMFNDLSTSIQETAVATRLFDPEQIAKGYYFWASTTGQVVTNHQELLAIQKQMIPVMEAAAMTETDLETALKGVIGVVQEFGLGISDASRVTMEMFYTAQKTATEFPDLIQSLKMVGPVAAQMNVSLEDTLKMLAALGNAGIKGTMAGRSLRQVFRQLNRETPAAASALDAVVQKAFNMNTTFKDMVFPQGKFAGMENMLTVLAKSTANLTDEQKGFLFSTIATAAEMPALIQLVNEQNKALKEGTSIFADGYKGFNLDDAEANFQRNWEMMLGSAKAIMGEIMNSIRPVILDIGNAVVATLRAIAPAISTVAGLMDTFIKGNPVLVQTVTTMMMLGAVVATLSGGYLLLRGAVKLLAGSVLPQFILETRKAALAQMEAQAGITGAGLGIRTVLIPSLKALAASLATTLGPLAIFIAMAAIVQASSGSVTKDVAKRFKELTATSEEAKNAFREVIKTYQETGEIDPSSNISSDVLDEMIKDQKFMATLGLDTKTQMASDMKDTLASIGDMTDGVTDELGALPKTYVDFAGRVYDGTQRGIYDPVKLTLDNVKGAFAEAGEAGPKAFLGGIFGNSADVQKAATYVVDTAVAEIKSGNKKIALAGRESLSTFVRDWLAEAGADVPPAAGGIANMAIMAMKEKDPALQQWGLGMTMMLGQAIKDGSIKNIGPIFNGVMADIQAKLKSGNPKIVAQGKQMLAMLAQGMLESDQIDGAAKVALQGFVNTLATTGDPKALQAGFDLFYSIVTGGNATMPLLAQTGANAADFALAGWISRNAQAFQGGQNWIATLTGGMATQIPGALGTILGLSSNVIGVLDITGAAANATGQNIVGGLTNGMIYMLPKLQQAMRAIIAGLAPILKLAPGGAAILAVLNAAVSAMGAVYSAGVKKIAIPKLPNLGQLVSGNLPDYNTGIPAPPSGSEGGSGAKEQTPLEKALEVAKQGQELYTALRALEGVDLKGLVKRTMGGVAEAMALAIKITLPYAKTISTKDLQIVADFADTAGKVAGAVKSAYDAFTPLADYKPVDRNKLSQLLKDMSALIGLAATQAKSWKTAQLVDAQLFAEAGKAAADAIGSAFEGLSKIGEYRRVPESIIRDIAADLGVALREFARIGKTFTQETQTVAKEFAESASSVVKTIGDAFEAFTKLSSYVSPTTATLNAIMATVKLTVQMFSSMASGFHFTDAQMASLTAFADLSSAVAGAISDTYQAFNETIEFVDQFRERVDLNRIMADIDASMAGFVRVANKYGPAAISQANDLAVAAQEIAKAIEAFWGLGKNASHDPDVLSANVQQAINSVMATVGVFVKTFYTTGANIIAQFVAGMRSQEGLLKTELQRISDMMTVSASNLSLTTTGEAQNMTITHVIKDPDHVLQAATPTQVADVLSGRQFITNLAHAVNTQ